MAAVERAHTLIVKFGADTIEDLAFALRQMAIDLERGELTVGCSGSPSVGSIYSYRIRPEQTHEKYFADIEAELTKSTGT